MKDCFYGIINFVCFLAHKISKKLHMAISKCVWLHFCRFRRFVFISDEAVNNRFNNSKAKYNNAAKYIFFYFFGFFKVWLAIIGRNKKKLKYVRKTKFKLIWMSFFRKKIAGLTCFFDLICICQTPSAEELWRVTWKFRKSKKEFSSKKMFQYLVAK